MKGVILTGFVDWVRDRYGDDVVDDILDSTPLDSEGAYTAVGVYDYTELIALAAAVAEREGGTADDVLRVFARESFGALARDHAFLLEHVDDGIRLLEVTESHIHVEVLELYPDTSLPTISTHRLPGGGMELSYASREPLAAMCHGRILGALDLYGDSYEVTCTYRDEAGMVATFLILPAASAS